MLIKYYCLCVYSSPSPQGTFLVVNGTLSVNRWQTLSALLQHAQSCLQATLVPVCVGRCPRLAVSLSVLFVLGSAGLEGASDGSAQKRHVSRSI